MKVHAAIISLLLPCAAHAGKEIMLPEEKAWFPETEFQIDLYGAYSGGGDGFGGGLGLNYFFHRNYAITVDATLADTNGSGAWQYTGNLVARYPAEFGSFWLAGYLKAGGGWIDEDGSRLGCVDLGVGMEVRYSRHFSIFAEYTSNWVPANDDTFSQTRLGVRWSF